MTNSVLNITENKISTKSNFKTTSSENESGDVTDSSGSGLFEPTTEFYNVKKSNSTEDPNNSYDYLEILNTPIPKTTTLVASFSNTETIISSKYTTSKKLITSFNNRSDTEKGDNIEFGLGSGSHRSSKKATTTLVYDYTELPIVTTEEIEYSGIEY